MLSPLRLGPGSDLRGALQARAAQPEIDAFFVLGGIGSLRVAQIRLAGHDGPTEWSGPLEVLSLSGSVCADGAHLHIAVADGQGRVTGGHVCAGCVVLTTAELLLAPLPQWVLSRAVDADTGYPELVIASSPDGLGRAGRR